MMLCIYGFRFTDAFNRIFDQLGDLILILTIKFALLIGQLAKFLIDFADYRRLTILN